MKRILAALILVASAVSAGHAQVKGMESSTTAPGQSHKGTAVVKKVDRTAGRVSLAHEPIGSIGWPAMTMSFKVNERALLDKLAPDRKIEFEFVQQGSDYVITSVK